MHTHALKSLFEFKHMVAISDTKIIVRVGALVDAIGRSSGSNGHDGGHTLGTLCLPHLLDDDHFNLKQGMKSLVGWHRAAGEQAS